MRRLGAPWAWLRRKAYRARLPHDMRHMRTAHPDFALRETGDGGFAIHWRRGQVGRVKPLNELARATTAHCFIVGTGPSLNTLDFERLRGHPCIGVNGSVLKSESASVPFRSHVITDRRFFLDRFELVEQALASRSECLFSFRGLSVVCERRPSLLRDANLFLLDEVTARYGRPKPEPDAFDTAAQADPDMVLHPTRRPSKGWVGFSRDIGKGVFTGQTVVFSALQVAVWLGYTKVFILGMDLGGTAVTRRFYESGGAAAPMRLDRDYDSYIRPAFEVASTVLAAQGVELYNLSPTSRLPADVVPRLTLDGALALARGPA